MSELDELLGLDWGDVESGGRTAFPYIHTAGAGLLSAFGAGALVAPLASLEQRGGLLPAGTPAVAVAAPDYVVILRKGAPQGDTLADATQVVIVGGKRFDGNGYVHGETFGKHFSFGFDAPSRVDLATKGGKKLSLTDVDKIIFCGGAETQTKVQGEAVGFSSYDPLTMLYDPAGGLYRYLNQAPDYTFRPQAQSAYWAQQRAAQQPFLATTRQRMQSGQTLQQALLAEKAARAAQAAAEAAALSPPPATMPGTGLMPGAMPMDQAPAAFGLPVPAQPDPANPGFLTDGNLDPNYQTPSSVVGTRSDHMSSDDEFKVLGEQAMRDLCGDLGRRGLEPGLAIVGDMGRRGLEPGAAFVGDLGRRGLEPGAAIVGDMGRRGLEPGAAFVGEMGRRGLEPGQTLLGAYLYGCDVLGAPVNPPRRSLRQAGFVVKTTPRGRTFTSLVVNRQAKHNPKQTLATMRTVAKRMQQVGNRALTTLAKVGKTSVKGASSSRRPVPRMAPAALRRLAEDLVSHGRKLGDTANKYEKTLGTMAARNASAQKRAQGVTKVHGLVDVVGDDGGDGYFEEIVGLEHQLMLDSVEILGDGYGAPVPDPTNPGYLTDGTPDPNYGGGGAQGQGAAAPSMPGPPDYGAGPAPDINSVAPQPGLDYQPGPDPSTDVTFYDCPTDDDLPLGAVVFDGSQRPAYLTLGSYAKFYNGGMLPGGPAPKGGPFSGYEIHDDGWWLLLQGTQPSTNYSGGRNYDRTSDPSGAMQSEGAANAWGPLVGAPTAPGTSTPSWTAGLRFSASGPNGPRWFWFWDQAPSWAQQPLLQARLNDAIVAYQAAVAAGKTDFVNQQIQDQIDAQDAAKAAKAQAAVDAQVAQAQEIEQQRELEAQARQAEQQAALDLAAQQQADQFQAQQNAAAASYLQQHPELMFAQDQGGGGGDGGGDDGGLPPEMQSDDSSDETPMNLDDSQIDWNG